MRHATHQRYKAEAQPDEQKRPFLPEFPIHEKGGGKGCQQQNAPDQALVPVTHPGFLGGLGGAMSGLLIAGRRDNRETIQLVFLMD